MLNPSGVCLVHGRKRLSRGHVTAEVFTSAVHPARLEGEADLHSIENVQFRK